LITSYPVEFADFLAMQQEVRDEVVHHEVQNNLIDYLWALTGDSI
jgi:hypothetical protein